MHPMRWVELLPQRRDIIVPQHGGIWQRVLAPPRQLRRMGSSHSQSVAVGYEWAIIRKVNDIRVPEIFDYQPFESRWGLVLGGTYVLL